MAEIIGWLGSLMLAMCGAPQALKSVRDGHSLGMSPCFLALWLSGELCFLYSTFVKFGFVSWLAVNYVGNVLCVLVIIYFALFPRARLDGESGSAYRP